MGTVCFSIGLGLGLVGVVLLQSCVAIMDLEELQNIHYDIDIHNIPVLLGRSLEKDVLYVNSKFGQNYECQLPDLSDFEKSQEEEKVASELGIAELLKPMEDACIIMTQGWWSYEFCYGKYVRQYHLENSVPQGDIIYLGQYESQMDWSNTSHKDTKRHKLNRYHSHTYVNGTECDLNGKARMAEVRFVCSEGEGDAIVRVNEPESCVYIVTVQTTRICHHPYLRPPPSLKPRPILCFPALDQMQYTEFITKKEVEEAAIEERKQFLEENLKRQKEELRKRQEAERMDKIKKAQRLVKTYEAQKKTEQQELEFIKNENDRIRQILKGQPTLDGNDNENIIEPAHKTANKDDSITGDLHDDADSENVLKEVLKYESKINKLVSEALGTVEEFQEDMDEEEKQQIKKFNTLLQDIQNIQKNLPDITDKNYDATSELRKITADNKFSQTTETKQFYKYLKQFKDEIVDTAKSEEEASQLLELADKFKKAYENLDRLEQVFDDMTEEEAQILFDLEDSMNILRNTLGDSDETQQLRKSVYRLSKELEDAKSIEEPEEAETVATMLPNDQIEVKVTKIKVGKKSQVESKTEVYDSDYRKIEDAVREQLENEGISTEGKVEIKILSFDPREETLTNTENEDEEDDDGMTVLSEEESTYFKNMIFGLLNGDAAVKEQKKHRKLESNYGFSYSKETKPEAEDE